MDPSEQKDSHPTLDVNEFWRQHDRRLTQHERLGNVTLSHDLYRGMPPWFNGYFAYFQRRVVLQIFLKCMLPPEARALDVGCGTGRWSGLMLSQGWKTFGTDIGEQALHYAATAWPEIHFACAMLPELCFQKDSFDLALSVTVLQHIPHAQQQQAIDAIARTLKTGGYLVICESIDLSDASPHIFGNSLENWSALFHFSGFRIISKSGCEFLPHVRFFHWLRRSKKTSQPSSGHSDVGAIAQTLTKYPILVVLVWLGIIASYPLEFIASAILPMRWARLGCFLLQKI